MNNKDMSQDSFAKDGIEMKYTQVSWEEELRAQQRRASDRRNALRREPSVLPKKKTWQKNLVHLTLWISTLVAIAAHFDLINTVARAVTRQLGEAVSSASPREPQEADKKHRIDLVAPLEDLTKTVASTSLEKSKISTPLANASNRVTSASVPPDQKFAPHNVPELNAAEMAAQSQAPEKKKMSIKDKIQSKSKTDLDTNTRSHQYENAPSKMSAKEADATPISCPESLNAMQLCAKRK